jgi:hypothetical protein
MKASAAGVPQQESGTAAAAGRNINAAAKAARKRGIGGLSANGESLA